MDEPCVDLKQERLKVRTLRLRIDQLEAENAELRRVLENLADGLDDYWVTTNEGQKVVDALRTAISQPSGGKVQAADRNPLDPCAKCGHLKDTPQHELGCDGKPNPQGVAIDAGEKVQDAARTFGLMKMDAAINNVTQYYNAVGTKLWEEPMIMRRIWRVGQTLIANSITYRVDAVEVSGNVQRVAVAALREGDR